MHSLEPHFGWRHLYTAEEDEKSPFFGREYSEFEFTNRVYNYVIHPQWDEIGSPTLFIKILYAEYDEKFAILELLGEWNDCIHNDIMIFKRDILEKIMSFGINKFIIVGENILNFHYDGDDYYAEWKEDIGDGWIALLNFQPHVLAELKHNALLGFFETGGKLNDIGWRTFTPLQLFQVVEMNIKKRINAQKE